MGETSYLISEASQMVNVEAHVLRYWEEELKLDIPRNDLGHRYYTQEHIDIFNKVKQLKEEGYQLKAIKANLQGDKNEMALPNSEEETLPDTGDKMEQFTKLMTNIVAEALSRNHDQLSIDISSRVGDKVVKEMDYLMRTNEEQQEERFKRLDETIRSHQRDWKVNAEQEAAAASAPEPKKKKKFRLFKRKKKAEEEPSTLYSKLNDKS